MVLSAFPLQWLIYGLSTPQSDFEGAQRDAPLTLSRLAQLERQKGIRFPVNKEFLSMYGLEREILSARAAAPDEPTIVMTHSMGGNILYDLLSSFAPDLGVDAWISVGGQVGLFEEMKIFAASDPELGAPNLVDSLKSPLKFWLLIDRRSDLAGSPGPHALLVGISHYPHVVEQAFGISQDCFLVYGIWHHDSTGRKTSRSAARTSGRAANRHSTSAFCIDSILFWPGRTGIAMALLVFFKRITDPIAIASLRQ